MKKTLYIISILIGISGILIYTRGINAQDYKEEQKETVFKGLDVAAGKDVLPMEIDKDNPDITVAVLIGGVINRVLQFLGVIFLILTIYGGFLWMTAGGNDEQVGKAKKIIVATSVGLGLVLSAYAVSRFVMYRIAGEIILDNSPSVSIDGTDMSEDMSEPDYGDPPTVPSPPLT